MTLLETINNTKIAASTLLVGMTLDIASTIDGLTNLNGEETNQLLNTTIENYGILGGEAIYLSTILTAITGFGYIANKVGKFAKSEIKPGNAFLYTVGISSTIAACHNEIILRDLF